ncbi:metallophosphoesterase [Flavobacteriaceae bacterium F08102]|nr:metallophosphoesterase [Flavobacteriaceae bacterium F08102]
MKNYSFKTILLLCFGILVVDIFSYYGLTELVFNVLSVHFQGVITFLFWAFTVGLITAIIVLKRRMDHVHPKRKQVLISKLYGLTVSSFIPKIIFVLFVIVLWLTKSYVLQGKWPKVISVVALVAGFTPFFAIVYAIYRAKYNFKIYKIRLKFDHLPSAFKGVSIVQISDLHLGSFNYKYSALDRAVELINELDADFIFFTGDIVNNFAWELDGWEQVLVNLKARLGKYAVLGNHDYGDYSQWEYPEHKKENFNEICSFFKKINFRLLRNEGLIIEQESEKIALLGVENWGKPPFKQYGKLADALQDVQSIPFKILLSHDPSHWSEEVLEHTNIALTLSGHTHGMQAGVNLRNKSWSPIKYKYKEWAGLYVYGQQYLYVNRGLGWMGFPGRLGMRPEITLITLE